MVAEAPVAVARWTPTARQAQVLGHIADLPEEEYAIIGYGGAAGGAKTNLLAQLAIEISLSCPGANTLVGRQALVDLKPTTLAEFDSCLPRQLLYRKYDSVPIYRDIRLPAWPPGVYSRVWFRDVRDADSSIGSEEYGWVLLEEAHEIKRHDILYLLSRMRHRPERKRGMVLAFNPFPSYVVDLFLEGTESIGDLEGSPVHLHYVPARIGDNPHLPANYEQMLRLTYADDPHMYAVLIEGVAGVVPNAVYGALKDPDVARILQAPSLPESTRFTRAGCAWDWGTSQQHKSAGVLGATDRQGLVWILDAWESASGSSNELRAVAQGWRREWLQDGRPIVSFARYDASQGSLADDLRVIYADTDKGIRDVEGRIRTGRGLVSTYRLRFLWSNPNVRALWRYLSMYHRDDDGRIVEEQDDMVDAFHYLIWALEHPTRAAPAPPISMQTRSTRAWSGGI